MPARSFEVSDRILERLLTAEVCVSAHWNLCSPHSVGDKSHPGDPFGEVLAWLWTTGRRDRAALFVADYLAEMRVHNPHAPEEGSRLTLDALLMGVGFAVSASMDQPEIKTLQDFLADQVPRYYGEAPKRLNTP
jgi:hypothetical protein